MTKKKLENINRKLYKELDRLSDDWWGEKFSKKFQKMDASERDNYKNEILTKIEKNNIELMWKTNVVYNS